jgi:hypothetical protein
MKKKIVLIFYTLSSQLILLTTYALAANNSGVPSSNKPTGNLKQWSCAVLSWSKIAILVIGTAMFLFAGVIYMTSAGNLNRISYAKKLITGAVSAILVLYLGLWFLKIVMGIELCK